MRESINLQNKIHTDRHSDTNIDKSFGGSPILKIALTLSAPEPPPPPLPPAPPPLPLPPPAPPPLSAKLLDPVWALEACKVYKIVWFLKKVTRKYDPNGLVI